MKQRILDILTQLRPEYDFSVNADFIEEGMLDSFDIVTLVTELEEAFGIVIDGVEILPDNFSSLGAIESLVKRSEKK